MATGCDGKETNDDSFEFTVSNSYVRVFQMDLRVLWRVIDSGDGDRLTTNKCALAVGQRRQFLQRHACESAKEVEMRVRTLAAQQTQSFLSPDSHQTNGQVSKQFRRVPLCSLGHT